MVKKLLEALKRRLGDHLISLLIFGSTAREDFKEESDIDILLIVKDKREAEREYLKAKLKIEGISPPFFSSIIATERELREDPYILLDIIEDHIMIYDPYNTAQRMLSLLKERLEDLGAKRVWLDEKRWYWNIKPDWRPGEVVEIKL